MSHSRNKNLLYRWDNES